MLHRTPPGRTRLPLAISLSIVGHVLFFAGLAGVLIWTTWNRPKVYVVNLVPAVAAVGVPAAPPAPSVPVRATAPAPPARTPAPEPTPRETAAPQPARLPEPAWSTPRLPARPALPRPGERDLPPLANPRMASVAPTARPEKVDKPVETRPTPSATQGLPTGSTAGVGALSVNASDFPYAWYLRQIAQKVQTEWNRQNRIREPGHRPVLYFEIQRDGSIKLPKVKESSGDPTYDQAALRAVVEASPFPPLPQDWSRPSLSIDLMFFLGNPG